MTPNHRPQNANHDAAPETARQVTPAARRALAEAEARRAETGAQASDRRTEKELGGRKGPDPTRYGDWEKGGLVSDF